VGIVMTRCTGAIEIAELDGRAVTGRVFGLDGAVTLRAGDAAVVAAKEIAIFAVGVGGELEGLGSVAALTSVTELPEVDIAVTGLAGFLHPLETNRAALPRGEGADLGLVAGNALDSGVFAGESERGARVVEFLRLEAIFVNGVTARTILAELSEMGVLVALCAGYRQVAVAT
jgi:hypothetical protein